MRTQLARQEMSVGQLVSQIEKGYIKKPEMQREYVWKATRVRDLLDSLYRGYPSGTILLWESDAEVATSEFAIDTENNSTKRPLLLLDGQQRLTSLSSILRGEPIVIREGKKKLKTIDILFNLEHPEELMTLTEIDDSPFSIENQDEDESEEDDEESLLQKFNQFTFIVSNNQLANLPNWVNVTDVFKSHSDADFLTKAGITTLDDPRYAKYSNRLQKVRAIRDYMYRLDVLESTLDYEEVTEIFIRVNSLGVKLRGSDLALAQITAKWRDSLVIFQDFQQKCYDEQGFHFDLGFYIRAMVICATGQSKFKTLGSIDKETLRINWGNAQKSIEYALNFLKSNIRIDSPALLTSPFIVLAIAYWGYVNEYKVSKIESDLMRRWVLIANTKSRYSSSAESLLDADLLTIRTNKSVEELLIRLKARFGRLDISEEELANRSSVSGYFKAMFLAFREDGAIDWETKLEISVNHSGMEHKLQFHHIFPKAFLKKEYDHLSRSQVNDISNLAFISGKTNREISDKPPAIYLKKIIDSPDKDMLEKQAIPTTGEYLEKYSYEDFLVERRKSIVKRLNKLLS